MAKRISVVVALFALLSFAFALNPAAALACEIDGFPGGLVPTVDGEQLDYPAGNVPAGDQPGVTPVEYAPGSPGSPGGFGTLLVLGMALLAAPLFATLTVVAARRSQRR